MNNLLQLKGTFEQASSNSRPGAPNLPSGKSVKISQLKHLQKNLIELKKFWSKENIVSGALVSVFYNKVAAKSNRMQGLLSKSNITANSSIVGARFTKDESPKHIITHYVSMELIDESIERLEKCIGLLNEKFGGTITHDIIKQINLKQIAFAPVEIVKTNFLKVIVDAFYIEKFDVLVDDKPTNLLPLKVKLKIVCFPAKWNEDNHDLDKYRIKCFEDLLNV